jgi:hypothetical protein
VPERPVPQPPRGRPESQRGVPPPLLAPSFSSSSPGGGRAQMSQPGVGWGAEASSIDPGHVRIS